MENQTNDRDLFFMTEALKEATLAYEKGEVPVGAVIVRNGEIIARAHNTRETEYSAIAHAEITAIAKASAMLKRWRLSDCTLYVTLEPCPMCAGAIINARIPRVVFGAREPSMGAMGSVLQIKKYPLPTPDEIVSGVLQEECGALLTQFFRSRRESLSEVPPSCF